MNLFIKLKESIFQMYKENFERIVIIKIIIIEIAKKIIKVVFFYLRL